MKEFKKKKVLMFKDDNTDVTEDRIVCEQPVTICLNERELVSLLCTPVKIDYLALGFLRAEGFIETKEDVQDLQVDPRQGLVSVVTRRQVAPAEKFQRCRTVTTGLGGGTTFFSAWNSLHIKPIAGNFQINSSRIMALMQQMQERALVFKQTGGVHSASLCDRDRILFFSEDIGRHNAIDKIVGESLWGEVDIKDKILVTSGRLSAEMMLKAAKLDVPVVVSRSAPTTLGIKIAEKMQITMIGFGRGRRFNVYTCPQRVIFDSC
ncbi:MAG: formate dehydrogenase accessory sulfurtransferase FdhD [Dethiobacteria bacterium]